MANLISACICEAATPNKRSLARALRARVCFAQSSRKQNVAPQRSASVRCGGLTNDELESYVLAHISYPPNKLSFVQSSVQLSTDRACKKSTFAAAPHHHHHSPRIHLRIHTTPYPYHNHTKSFPPKTNPQPSSTLTCQQSLHTRNILIYTPKQTYQNSNPTTTQSDNLNGNLNTRFTE